MRTSHLVVCLAIAGCGFLGSPPKVPSACAGTVPLTIVNGANRTIFSMLMYPDGATLDPNTETGSNWLGKGQKALRIDNGKQHTFYVKPGAYRGAFFVTDINGQSNLRYIATTGGTRKVTDGAPLEISGPTYLIVGTASVPPPPAGVATHTIPLIDTYGPATANCKPDHAPASSADECCSRLLDADGFCAVSTD